MKRRPKLLIDLRPALQGFAGIPQEARLLFRGFCLDDNLSVDGFLQMQDTSLAPGILPGDISTDETWGTGRRFHSLAQVIISVSEGGYSKDRRFLEFIREWIRKHTCRLRLVYGNVKISLGRFETRYFEDFVWRYLFSKTLSSSDFALVTSRDQRVCSVSWEAMQDDGLDTLSISSTVKYPTLDTSEYDIFIAHTPYPGRTSPNTTMVIRYHDAIPIFLPHTIAGKSKHEAMHFHALLSNVESGAWFACVSETSRQQLLTIFPEAKNRTVTMHNMISPQYFVEDSNFEEARKIILTRKYLHASKSKEHSKSDKEVSPGFGSLRDHTEVVAPVLHGDFRYLLVVSTIDPRKNHSTCIAAWQAIKRRRDPNLKLVLVGSLGSDYGALPTNMITELANGDLVLLDEVPAGELRVLYRHASATVCPSFSEGFDYSGVEAMRSGGVVVASDIAVHREIYQDAAEYFDPYSSDSAEKALNRVLYDSESERVQLDLRKRSDQVSARYLPENIMPKWASFLKELSSS